MEVSITCTNCNYKSRVAAVTLANNMFYCQNCGKQIENPLPQRSSAPDDGQARRGGSRRPANRSRNARPGPSRRR